MASILIHSEPHPEDNAMLQALYSRSADSVLLHIERLKAVGSGKFMSQFYKGYGHASIADCGFTTIYFEGISMLAAVALEDDPLFNGQESSTRYIDFSQQAFVIPDHFNYDNGETTNRLAEAAETLRSFYVAAQEPLKADLRLRYPIKEDENEKIYEKAIAARAFDILRAWLPAGATTNVAWTTSLRKANERLVVLMHHPLEEIREIAAYAYASLHAEFPNSFQEDYAAISATGPEILYALEKLEGAELFNYYCSTEHFYSAATENLWPTDADSTGYAVAPEFDLSIAVNLIGLVKPHPKKALASRHSNGRFLHLCTVFNLDFGSFRDIHRHRGGYCANPIIKFDAPMHQWYLDQLPTNLCYKGMLLLDNLRSIYNEVIDTTLEGNDEHTESMTREELLEESIIQLQYLIPMGILVPVFLNYDVNQFTYVTELRSGKTVHSTLRHIAHKMSATLTDFDIVHYADLDPDDWTLRRGTQDIVAKE